MQKKERKIVIKTGFLSKKLNTKYKKTSETLKKEIVSNMVFRVQTWGTKEKKRNKNKKHKTSESCRR